MNLTFALSKAGPLPTGRGMSTVKPDEPKVSSLCRTDHSPSELRLAVGIPNPLSLILSVAAWIRRRLSQHEAVSKPSDRFGLAPDSLINLLNKLLDWFTLQIYGKSPLLVIDHVDKIRDAAAAEDVLVKAVPHWNRIRASIVMTAPFEHTLGDLRHSVESKWGRPIMLYPVAIPRKTSGPIPVIYVNIVKNAGLDALIHEESLRLLAHYSGGILRSYVQFLIDACKQAHLASNDRIEPSDARKVIQKCRKRIPRLFDERTCFAL